MDDTAGSRACSECPSQSSSVGAAVGFGLLILFAVCVLMYAVWRSEGELVPKYNP